MISDAVFRLGPFQFENPIALAPMAGISDRVFRNLCLDFGANYSVTEMIASNPRLRASHKTQRRLDHRGAHGPRIVQIAGADPSTLADAARYCADRGADVIDVNMGCPAKKVCNKFAGSALLRDEPLVAALIGAVVKAVDIPVTLKMRTGWDTNQRNGPAVARIAEDLGIQMLTVHGRTRACGFKGAAEYDTIARIKHAVSIPVIANGDIRCANEAAAVLAYTKCDGLMIGRAAFGNPWIFAALRAGLNGRSVPRGPHRNEVLEVLRVHVGGLHELYGVDTGVRVARKHAAWYSAHLPDGQLFRQEFNRIADAKAQLALIENYRNAGQGALAA
jgi:tRNA-dihydrouridine synthase B